APAGLLNPTNYVERMVGDKISLLQTRQRHEALATLGYFKGDVASAWGPSSVEALRNAQAALAINIDGKWGPQTEDAIHKALADIQGCTSEACAATGAAAEVARPGASLTRAGWFVVGGVTLASVGLGLAIA